MDGTLHFKFKGPFPSGFILQKDVYTTNLLFANDQLPIKKISKLLPFRPPTGRVPQDPSSCLQITKLDNFYTFNTEKDLFYSKRGFKTKKLNKRKLKFPIPKYRLTPLSAMDFYSNLRQKGLRIKYIEDDLNISSRNGKKILFYFREDYYTPKFDVKEKIKKPNLLKKENEFENEDYNNYFDFGFHSRNSEFNINFNTVNQQIYRNKKSAIQRTISTDKTFQTQIDFNLLDKYKKINRAHTAKVKSNKQRNINN